MAELCKKHQICMQDKLHAGFNGNGLDGSGLSSSKENAGCLHASSVGAQPTACGNIASRVANRVLLEQRLVKSVAKDTDRYRWFSPGKKSKKARHQDAQERMDDLIEGVVVEGSFMRQAIKTSLRDTWMTTPQ